MGLLLVAFSTEVSPSLLLEIVDLFRHNSKPLLAIHPFKGGIVTSIGYKFL